MAKHWYAVGPDDGEGGWMAVQAVSTTQAKSYWKKENGDCGWLDAKRVREWAGLERVRGPDWISAGLSYSCDSCGEQACAHDDPPAVIRDGAVFHEDCL